MAKAIGTYTIVSLNDGNNVIQMLLSNENHTLPANASGTPTTYAGASTSVTVYDGAKDVTADYTITFTASTGITATKSGNTVTVTKVTNGTGGTVTIKATKGSNSLTKVFTISLSKAGVAGTSVKVSSKTVTYQLGDSGTTAPTGTWSATVPTLTPKKYLWTKTYIKYSDNTEVTSYSVSYIAKDGTNGTNGKNGNDGRGIASTVITYQASSSGTTTPTGTWQSTIPTVAAGHYLWTKTVINYTSGEPTTSYSVSMMGKTGANGTSISITSKSVTYQIGTSGTTTPTGTWQATVPTLESGKYLWTKTYVKYSDSSETTSYAVSYCAKDGAKGDKGDTGAAGKGISSTTIDYQKSTSGTTVPTGTWSTTIPTVAAKEYLWTRTTIKYTSGSDSVSYSVGMMGATGAAGSSAKLVSVTASSQVFKSTKGATGTFTPEYIYLYPRFQSVSYSKWQYSTNGTTWNNVTSGSNSLTVGTYNSVANSLRVERNCNLYTKDITAVSFRCVSSNASVYDTTTIIKVYDVTDLQIGGRNLILKTKQFTEGDEFWSIHPVWKITQGIDCAEASTSRSGSTTADWYRLVPRKKFNILDINEHDGATVSFDLKIDDTSVFDNGCICALQIWDATNTRIGWYEWANIITGSGYNKKVSDITNEQWTRVSVYFTKSQLKTISVAGKKDDDISFTTLSFQLVRNGSIHIRKVKAEWGNVATDWTPAPEDVEDSISGLNTYVDQVKDNLQNQIDGAIQFWNGENIPALSNYPANEWTTEELRINHQADIYTVIKDVSGELKQGKSYRFDKVNGAWKWIELTDNELSAVQALASSKAKVFISTPTVPYNVGDLWLKNKTLWRCKVAKDASGSYALSDWEVATIYTDDSYAKQVQNNLNNLQIGGRNYVSNLDYNWVPGNWSIPQVGGKTEISTYNSRISLVKPIEVEPNTDYWIRVYSSKNINALFRVCDSNDNFIRSDISLSNKKWTSGPNDKYLHLTVYENSVVSDITNGITKIKFEKGNKATDWTPAPEDVESELIYKSDTDPSDPYEGMLWLNTSTGILYVYTSGQWMSEDMSKYLTNSDLENINSNKNKTWITKPTPPYYAGDLWVVQDKNDTNYGKILTCVVSRARGTNFNVSDWIVPLTSYTTVKDMTNVIGTDPTEWSSTSKSLTSLINENTNELEGQKGQMASLAVRASGIEMSFSRTGTMNFLGNSSGQNSVKNWTLSNATKIRAISASDASDINQSLVSLSAFRFDMSGKNLTMTSALFTPPTSDIFTLSAKVKVPGKYTYITFTLNLFSDMKGTTKVGSKVLNVSYAVNAENTFILHHTSINKKDYAGGVQTAQLVINVVQDTSKYISENPANHLGKLSDAGKIYFYNSTYTYIKPVYKKINIVEFDSALDSTNLRADVAYKCTKDLPKDSLSDSKYVRGTYYTIMQDALHPKLRPITDGYNIMMLDSGDYHYITNTGTSENIETSSKQFSFTPGVVYIGDIMINGGQNVQTWTPRQDENLWGDYIKFDYSGITIENVPKGYRRTIDSSSDIAFQIDDSGNIVKCIWKLTQDGFITNDIKCIGTFAMGYVTNDASPDLDNTFKSVMEMKKNQEQTGIDEYLFVNS